jgi:hypothetical protein
MPNRRIGRDAGAARAVTDRLAQQPVGSAGEGVVGACGASAVRGQRCLHTDKRSWRAADGRLALHRINGVRVPGSQSENQARQRTEKKHIEMVIRIPHHLFAIIFSLVTFFFFFFFNVLSPSQLEQRRSEDAVGGVFSRTPGAHACACLHAVWPCWSMYLQQHKSVNWRGQAVTQQGRTRRATRCTSDRFGRSTASAQAAGPCPPGTRKRPHSWAGWYCSGTPSRRCTPRKRGWKLPSARAEQRCLKREIKK